MRFKDVQDLMLPPIDSVRAHTTVPSGDFGAGEAQGRHKSIIHTPHRGRHELPRWAIGEIITTITRSEILRGTCWTRMVSGSNTLPSINAIWMRLAPVSPAEKPGTCRVPLRPTFCFRMALVSLPEHRALRRSPSWTERCEPNGYVFTTGAPPVPYLSRW